MRESADDEEMVATAVAEDNSSAVYMAVPVERNPAIDLLPDVVYDEDGGTPLNHEEVKEGIERELAFMKELHVGDPVHERSVPWGTKTWTGR